METLSLLSLLLDLSDGECTSHRWTLLTEAKLPAMSYYTGVHVEKYS